MELVAGSVGVYCSAMKLQVAVRGATTASMLARYLMEVFWEQATLAQSSLSAKGVYTQSNRQRTGSTIPHVQIYLHRGRGA